MRTETKMVGGALARFRLRMVTSCFNTWRETSETFSLQAQQLRRALSSMAQSKLYAAWNRWRQNAQEMKNEEAAMSGAMKRWLEQKLSGSFHTWRSDWRLLAADCCKALIGASCCSLCSLLCILPLYLILSRLLFPIYCIIFITTIPIRFSSFLASFFIPLQLHFFSCYPLALL